jgi:gamma-glutamylcyclotransferase (GGCT)/AIG2-like uncharacterized protein YtfP
VRIAFYGTLMRGFGAQRRLGVEGALRYEGACRIAGALWDLGPYPGLTEGGGEAAGELFAVLDEAVLATLDEFEGLEYARRRVALIEPPVEAWIYFLAAHPRGRALVPSGCWRTHTLRGGGSRSG